uniref:Uncharacterized protein n=1 Tax=Anguilla anguilla TaxID=7936 RepID=A0A0E9XUD6_ANGAN
MPVVNGLLKHQWFIPAVKRGSIFRMVGTMSGYSVTHSSPLKTIFSSQRFCLCFPDLNVNVHIET